MTEKKIIPFKFLGIKMPKIDSVFITTPIEANYKQMYRVEGVLLKNKKFRLLFGTQIVSEELLEDKTPKVKVIVESIGEFEFESEVPGYENISDIPLLPNMLALMYPFIREKINYCFTANNEQFLLTPVNTFKLIEQNKEGFTLHDARKDIEDEQPKQIEAPNELDKN